MDRPMPEEGPYIMLNTYVCPKCLKVKLVEVQSEIHKGNPNIKICGYDIKELCDKCKD